MEPPPIEAYPFPATPPPVPPMAGPSGSGGPAEPGGPADAGGSGGGRRKLLVAGVAVAVVAIGVVVAVAVWPHHHKKTQAAPRLPAAPTRPLVGGGGGQMLALLKTGQGQTFHATFHAVSTPPKPGDSLDFEIWQAPPRLREDTIHTADGHTDRTASVVDNKVTTFCTQRDTAAWACHPVNDSSTAGIQAIEATVTAATAGQTVVVSDTKMGGRDVRCFDIGAGPNALKLCATLNGIPVLISNAEVRYELATIDSTVQPSAFNPPK